MSTNFTHSTALSSQHPPAQAVLPLPVPHTPPAKNPWGTKCAALGTWQGSAIACDLPSAEDLDSQVLEMTSSRAAAEPSSLQVQPAGTKGGTEEHPVKSLPTWSCKQQIQPQVQRSGMLTHQPAQDQTQPRAEIPSRGTLLNSDQPSVCAPQHPWGARGTRAEQSWSGQRGMAGIPGDEAAVTHRRTLPTPASHCAVGDPLHFTEMAFATS